MTGDREGAHFVTDPAGSRLGIGRILLVAVSWQMLGIFAWSLPSSGNFLTASLCGSLALSLLAEPGAGRLSRSLLFGTGFVLVWVGGHAASTGTALQQPMLIGALLGLGTLAELSLHPPKQGAVTLGAFGIPLFAFITALLLVFTGIANPTTKDAVLLEADRALGGLPSYAIATALTGHAALWTFARIAYGWLPLELALVVAVAVRRGLPAMRPGPILFACALAGVLGAAAYWICPATGPREAFPGFPSLRPGPLPLTEISVAPRFPRNAIPSLHFTWAWLLWRMTRPLPWLHYLALACLIGVVVGTLGFGEHYVIDLVVALPFATAVEAIVARTGWPRVATGLAATTAWLLLFRNDRVLGTPAAWLAVAGTLAISLWVAPRIPFAAPMTTDQRP